MTEKDMREAESARPKTIGELSDYIQSRVQQEHDYGTCCYAMSLSAVAAFNYVAHELGVTGFQSSCADLDILRRTRRIEGPFMLLKLNDALYPQYSLREKLDEFIAECRPWLKERAAELLAKSDKGAVHPNVWAHWEWLAS
jgi:hypothetical protein